MKPLGRNTNSLIRTAWAAALREKTTRKKRLTDRARTFKKLGLDIQKNMRRPAAGAFFHLTSPFIGQCYRVPVSLVFKPDGVFETHSRLIWLILHQGTRYEERGPAVTKRSSYQRTWRMIRQLRTLGYRVELSNPQPSLAQA